MEDYRVYDLITSASIKPKNYSLKMVIKARETIRSIIPIKVVPFTFRIQKPIPELEI